MYTQEGESLGDTTADNHLLSHIEEKYYVPSLLTNAMKEHAMGILIHDDILAMMMLCSNPEDVNVPNHYKEKGMMFKESTTKRSL